VIKSVDLCTDTSVKKVRNTLSLKHENVDDPTTVQHANENTNTESADEQLLCKMSYLFDGELYKIVTLDGIKVSAKCTTCSKVINGHTTSTGNFLSHIKVLIFLLLGIYLYIYCYYIYLILQLKHSFMMSKVQAKKDAIKKRANDELSTNNLKQSKLSFNESEITKKNVRYNSLVNILFKIRMVVIDFVNIDQ